MSYSTGTGTRPIHSVLQNFSKETTIYRGTAGVVSYRYLGRIVFCLPRCNEFCYTNRFSPLGYSDTESDASATCPQASSASLISLDSCCSSLNTCYGHSISLVVGLRALVSPNPMRPGEPDIS